MVKCISFGLFDKKYFYLITLDFILLLFFYSFKYAIDENHNVGSNNILLFVLLSYIGQSLAIFFQIIINKYTFNNRNNDIKQCKKNKNVDNYPIKYIFNDLSRNLSNKDTFFFIIFCLLLLFIDILKSLMINIWKSNEINNFGFYHLFLLFFLVFQSYFFYHIKFYRHQYFSIIIILLSEIALLLFECYKYNLNDLFYFLFQLFISFLDSLFIIYIKGLMLYKYFSPYKLMYTFGIINSVLLLIMKKVGVKLPS